MNFSTQAKAPVELPGNKNQEEEKDSDQSIATDVYKEILICFIALVL